MRIAESARKHGISDDAILHAWENRMREIEYEYDGEDRILVIGADLAGNPLELVVVPVEEPARIIHADKLRERFYDFLR